MTLDYRKIIEEIIIMEKDLLNEYYKVSGTLKKNKLKKAILNLKESCMREQFYFFTLNLDYTDLNNLCNCIEEGDFEGFEGLSLKDKLCITERVSNIFSDMILRKTLEDRMRAYIPNNEAINNDTIVKYCSLSSVFSDYCEYLTNRRIRKYPTLEYMSVISKMEGDKKSLNKELVSEAFMNYLVTNEFFNSLLNDNFNGVQAERIAKDQEKSGMDPYIYYAFVHKFMEDEAFDLTGIIEANADNFIIDLNLEKLKVIIQYLDVMSLIELSSNFVSDKEVLDVIEREILTRNEYIKGKAEYYEDSLLEENKLVTDLLDASSELLNLYEEAAYLEMTEQRESDKYKEIIVNIGFKQNEERALVLNVLDDIKAAELMDTILFSKGIKTYYDVAGVNKIINEKDEDLIKERLQKLLEYQDNQDLYNDIDYDENIEVQFIPNDAAISLYLETGFDIGQPLQLHDFYHQTLQMMINKGLDEYITTSDSKEFLIDLKYCDLFTEPIMDKVAVDNQFDFKQIPLITPDYLSIVSSMENVSYELVKNSLAYYMNEYAKAQSEMLTEEESPYNDYLKAKINSVTDIFPNNSVKVYHR